MEKEETNIIELTEESMESMVYTIRGVEVMLDFDLARIYGYETKYLNRQVQRNIGKFPEDFMFQLNNEEVELVLKQQNFISNWKYNGDSLRDNRNERDNFVKQQLDASRKAYWNNILNSPTESKQSPWCQNVTLNKSGNLRGTNVKYLPYAFTEQGIYMLMTVLKGELAASQSIRLVRLFKKMKDYITKTKNITNINGIIELTNKVNDSVERIEKCEKKVDVVMNYFVDPSCHRELTILNNQKFTADVAYQEIYSTAKHNVLVIDDYIDIKTLNLLRACRENTSIVICSDNKAKNKLNDEFINDFIEETGLSLTIKRSNGIFHDRYIVIDYGYENETIYLCGSSSKDTGKKVTIITKLEFTEIYHPLIEKIVG